MTRRLTQKFALTTLFSSILIVSGCGSDTQDITLTATQATAEQAAQTKGSPIFDPLTSTLPFPNDLMFSNSTDGTLNIPVTDANDGSDPKVVLNELDGYSTSSAMSVTFSKAMDAASVAAAVKVYEVTIDAATKATTGYTATLTPGTPGSGADYAPSLSSDGKTLAILPLKPLKPKTTYLVVVTNDLKDKDGNYAVAGATYGNYLKSANALIKDGKSVVASLSNESATTLENIRQFTQAQLAVANAVGVSKDKVIMSWSFSTQSTTDVLAKVTQNLTANTSLALVDTTQTTSTFGGSGNAKIYAGSISVPYYQTAASQSAPTAPLTSKWAGQQGNTLTQFSVAKGDSPKKTADVTIPVLATVPTSGSNWPVVIFQHGITGDRSNVIALGDSLAQAGFVAIAIDLPMHGITPSSTAAALRNASVTERTFDVDYVTQNSEGTITATSPDGVKDTSGRHFVQLTSLLTTRDNMRQAVSDLSQLKSALGNITGLNVDETKVHFVGHSLGGMVGAAFVQQNPDLKTAAFAMSGLQAAQIFVNSPSFGPEVKAGLALKGIKEGSADFNSFVVAAQTAVDSADPVNYVGNISVPSLLLEVVGDGNSGTDDQVIPNSITTSPLGGSTPWAGVQGLASIKATGAVTGNKGVIRFTAGDHKSLLLPTSSLTTTQAMQQAIASFAASNGASVSMSDNSTVKQ